MTTRPHSTPFLRSVPERRRPQVGQLRAQAYQGHRVHTPFASPSDETGPVRLSRDVRPSPTRRIP